MLPPQLALEWKLWILLNGLPGIFAATMFLLYPPFDMKFGWNVIPRASGIMLGVGFLMRVALYIQQFTAPDYQAMRWLYAGNLLFSGLLLLISLVWGDTFHWRRFIAIAWLFLYTEEPVWMLTLVPRSNAAIAGQPLLPGGPINPLLQGTLFLEAAIMLVFGIALFLYPRFPNIISWQPDRTSAKVLATWPLSYAIWAPTLALSANFEVARGGIIVNMVFLAALIVALLVFRSHFDLSHRSTRLMLIGAAILLVLLSIGFVLQR